MSDERLERLQDQLNELRYQIGDSLGDRSPEYFRRRRDWTTDFLAGVGSVLLAVGIGYVIKKFSDGEMRRLTERFSASENGSADQPVKKGERATKTPQGRTEREAAAGGSDPFSRDVSSGSAERERMRGDVSRP